MKKVLSFLFIGGDLRQLRAAEGFAKDGHSVCVYGMEKTENGYIKHTENPEGEFSKADVVVLPLPYSIDKEKIYAPFSKIDIYISEIKDKLRKEQILLVGKADMELKLFAEMKGMCLIDYLNREEFAVLNSIPTAEGAIAVAMNQTTHTIHSSNCLVLGYGRIGKVLAKSLKGLGANCTVAVRKYKDLAWLSADGIDGTFFSNLDEKIGKYNIIFNTVPEIVLDFNRLSKTSTDCLIIDLASRPGGVDIETAARLGRNVISALSLPGKVAPDTAGDIVKTTISNILEEMEVSGVE